MKEKEIKRKKGKNDVQSALLKRALGYDTTETVEEYGEADGEIRLIKKKVTVKNVPPDLSALKLLLESEVDGVANMTDEQLVLEKERLLALLKQNEKDKEKNS